MSYSGLSVEAFFPTFRLRAVYQEIMTQVMSSRSISVGRNFSYTDGFTNH